MMKRIQNKVAESRRTLSVTVLYGLAVWLLAGLEKENWWIQAACFAISVFLMMEINNQNLLIRIYSRMVSVSFIALFCAAAFLFPSMPGAIMQLCVITSLLLLYGTYQDKASPGKTFYLFFCLSLASTLDIHVLYYIPVVWLLMATTVYSLGWRTFFASLIGILTPYWFMFSWYLYKGDIDPMLEHLSELVVLQPIDYTVFDIPRILYLAFLLILFITGTVHFVRTSHNDKIRVRQVYYSFIALTIVSYIFLALQPTLYDMVIRMLIITISPLIAHFIALTHTKITNIAFLVMIGAVLILTGLNLWISSSLF